MVDAIEISLFNQFCPHGLKPDGRYKGLWYAPFSQCMCCGIMFPYVDSAWSTDGSWTNTWTPKDRCLACGGKYVEWSSK